MPEITWEGGPTDHPGVNAGYWRLKSKEKFRPPYTWTGRMRLHEVMDPPVFGYGWKSGEAAIYSPGINWHPLYPSNNRNVGIGIGRRRTPTRVSSWAEMRDVRPDDAYGSRSGYESRSYERVADPMDGEWHTFRCEVLSYSHYQMYWDEVLIADIIENEPPSIDPGFHSVGLRLDFCHIDITDMKVTQHMEVHQGIERTPEFLDEAERILDTREVNRRLPHRETTLLPLVGRPPAGATHVIVSFVAVAPYSDGWLSMFAGGSRKPDTSNLNYEAGSDTTGFGIVPVSPDGEISAYTTSGTDLVIDMIGYYT